MQLSLCSSISCAIWTVTLSSFLTTGHTQLSQERLCMRKKLYRKTNTVGQSHFTFVNNSLLPYICNMSAHVLTHSMPCPLSDLYQSSGENPYADLQTLQLTGTGHLHQFVVWKHNVIHSEATGKNISTGTLFNVTRKPLGIQSKTIASMHENIYEKV
jgi:hypothetical protein